MGLLGHGNQKDDMPIHIIKCKINNKFAARFLLYFTKVCFEKKLDQHCLGFVGHPHMKTHGIFRQFLFARKLFFFMLDKSKRDSSKTISVLDLTISQQKEI